MIMRNSKLNIAIATDPQELVKKTLELFIDNALKSIEADGRFCAAISRHTPSSFFRLLGSEPRSKSLPWNNIHFFCVDECCGSSDLVKDNYGLATRVLIPTVGMPIENIHHICSECGSCVHTALMYEQTICNVVKRKKDGVPRFDLFLLQLGADGHVASLFPDTYAFFEPERLVWVSHFMDTRHTRITMTHPILHAASHIVILVSGREKAGILREIFTREPDVARYPVHALWNVLHKVTWLVDRDAVKFLLPHAA